MTQRIFVFLVKLTACGLSAPALSACGTRECLCDSTYGGASLHVQTSPASASIQNLTASVTGDITQTLVCDGSPPALCAWPAGPEDAGTYPCSIHVSASGYRSIDVPATVTLISDPSSCCSGPSATLSPSTATLELVADGGG